jgi:hypothetical protein
LGRLVCPAPSRPAPRTALLTAIGSPKPHHGHIGGTRNDPFSFAAGYNPCLHSRWTATSAKTSRMNSIAPPLLWAEVARNGAEPATAGLRDERDQVPRPPMSVVAVPRDYPECGGTHRKVPARLSAAVRSCPGFARANCLLWPRLACRVRGPCPTERKGSTRPAGPLQSQIHQSCSPPRSRSTRPTSGTSSRW